jgi:uncharacterized protein YndB with AHSA1/START domain
MTIHKVVRVRRRIEDAFRLFTAEMTAWWPLHEGYSTDPARAHQVILEGHVGGRFFERYVDGVERVVGHVTTWEPPHRVVFSWRAPDWEAATEVEVRFTNDGDGTRVELDHRGWEAGPVLDAMGKRFDGGWETVLARYVSAANV